MRRCRIDFGNARWRDVALFSWSREGPPNKGYVYLNELIFVFEVF